jgi:hypothetical protein
MNYHRRKGRQKGDIRVTGSDSTGTGYTAGCGR